jgi:hypothetical protein
MCTIFGANVEISSRAKQFPPTHLNFLCGRKSLFQARCFNDWRAEEADQ